MKDLNIFRAITFGFAFMSLVCFLKNPNLLGFLSTIFWCCGFLSTFTKN